MIGTPEAKASATTMGKPRNYQHGGVPKKLDHPVFGDAPKQFDFFHILGRCVHFRP